MSMPVGSPAPSRDQLPLFDNRNKLKLGTFATNVSYGLSISHAPTSYHVSWDQTVSLAKRADEMGLDMVVPLGRWKGMGGTTNYNGESFETLTWAAGIAQATERIMVFATVHVPTIHPISAAKQAVTVDHISGGRFGLNMVMGWFGPELAMFGAPQREHDDRYRVGDEWITILKKLWTEEEPFDFDGEFFQLSNAESHPKPLRKPYPVIMNAGASKTGSDFAARNADVTFVLFEDLDHGRQLVKSAHERAAGYGRDLLVCSTAYVVCRDTEAEAKAALQTVLDHGDHRAAYNMMNALGIQSGSFEEILSSPGALDRFVGGFGAYPIVGTPEQVAEKLGALYDTGVHGWLMGFHDYTEELEYFNANVMPLLRKDGLRA